MKVRSGRPAASAAIGWITLVLGIGAVVLAALRAEQQLNEVNFHAFDDWRTYANAVDRWMNGRPIYTDAQLAGPYQLRDTLLTGFTYPPAALPFFLPFAAGTPGLIAWIALNVGTFLVGIAGVLRVELGRVTPLAMGLTLIALAAFPPFSNAVVSGNLNLAVAGALAWLWVWRSGMAITVLAAVGAVLKVYPGLLAAWQARTTGMRAIGEAIAITLGLAVVSVPLVGVDAWIDFGMSLANAVPECARQGVSIACGLDPLVGTSMGRVVGGAVSLALVVIVVRAKSPFVAYTALAGALLAPVADMHPHYWIIAWVAGFVGVTRIIGGRSRRRGLAVAP